MSECWLPVADWEGLYEVSDLGRVHSVKRDIIRRPQLAKTGYQTIMLTRPGQRITVLVHRLVLEAFVGPCPEGMLCCHGEGGPTDNRLTNLRWDTPTENNLDQVRMGVHGMSRRKTCTRGHQFAGPNLRQTAKQRYCLACHNARSFITRTGGGDMDALADQYYERIMVTETGDTVFDRWEISNQLPAGASA